MKTKKNKPIKVSRKKRLTLMAVQEKLGLFAGQTPDEDKQPDHECLKNKPLGLI
ncbi:MAG: hypothetical protein JW757_11070 [Anaerolineales bacterium]|nr:hypothetical protein [Anaerolineales bacterium]